MHATDFSATAPEQLTAAVRESGLADRITTTVHDVRDPLPAPDASVDAVFAFFDEALLKSYAQGWKMHRVDAFEEGGLPRRLWRITQANRWPRRWFGSHLSARAGRRSSAACCAVRGRGRSPHSPRR